MIYQFDDYDWKMTSIKIYADGNNSVKFIIVFTFYHLK